MKTVNFRVVMMLLGVVVFTTLFSACSDDKDDDKKPIIEKKSSIIGKWVLDKMTLEDSSENIIESINDCPSKKQYYTFYENGKLNLLDYNTACESFNGILRWKIDGKTLTTDYSPYGKEVHTNIYKIKELTSSKMLLLLELSLTNGRADSEEVWSVNGKKALFYMKKVK